jgi:glycosyltransferase involved in cell wall biosynthesis
MTILAPFVWPFISLERKLKDKLFIADVIIVHSNFVKKNVENFVKKPVKVIPYPYFGKINKVEKKLGKKVKLLFIGRIVRQKGVNMIPNIARELKKCGIDYEINVLGDGPLLQKLKDSSKGINVNYHGAVYDEKIKEKFFLNSDILLVPSLWEEPFGIVALEAMANGLPVIASDRGGLGEIIKNNEIGITCEPTIQNFIESIKKIISNETLYKILSMNCYEKIKNYSPEKIFEEYRKLFENLSNS